jgi:hypothetical protein
VHSALDTQEVVWDVPVTKIVEPGPGLDAMKLLPDISSVKPPADPAYALDGARDEMFGALEMVMLAVPDWLVSSELVATMLIRFGEGAEDGATYSPEESIDPHAPKLPHPAPAIVHVTCWSSVPAMLAANCCWLPLASVVFPGNTLTTICGRIVTLAEALLLPSA